MLAEGIHSLVDTGNQGLLLYGLHKAKKPPDEKFACGHGKEVYFWSFVVAIMIFAMGAGISLYEGVVHILHPEPVRDPMVNYVVLGFALIFEGGAWFFAFKEFSRVKGKWSYVQAVQRGKDPTIFMVLFEDSAAVLGLIVAFFGIWLGRVTGIVYLDGIATVIIGLILQQTSQTGGLFDLQTGMPIEMVGVYDEMSPRSYPHYPGGSSLQRWHRELLRDAMEAEGFNVYEYEWWHFDFAGWENYAIQTDTFEALK